MNIAIDAGAVAAIVGWCQWAKMMIPEKFQKFLWLLAIGFGVLYALAFRPGCTATVQCAAMGVVFGLSAAGAFSGIKNVTEKSDKK